MARAGGHTGSVPTSLLVPQVVDAVGKHLVVLAAGGIFDGRGLVSALAYGADGVAMGTRFLLSAESTVPDVVKSRYLAATVVDTVVSAKIDGAPQRVIRTDFIDQLDARPGGACCLGRSPAPTPFARSPRCRCSTSPGRAGRCSSPRKSTSPGRPNAPVMTKAALVDGHPEVGILLDRPGGGADRGRSDGGRDRVGDDPAANEVLERMCGGPTS